MNRGSKGSGCSTRASEARRRAPTDDAREVKRAIRHYYTPYTLRAIDAGSADAFERSSAPAERGDIRRGGRGGRGVVDDRHHPRARALIASPPIGIIKTYSPCT